MKKYSKKFLTTREELLSRRDFVKGLLGGCLVLVAGCSHEDILGQFQSNSDSSPDVHFGTGEDGDITVYSGTVDIRAIYEDDVVTGVITGRGTDKGLNRKGIDVSDYYDPQNGKFINAKNFTIQSSGTLTATNPYGDGTDGKKGIIWIACTETFENQGLITMAGKGWSGGGGGVASGKNGAAGSGTGAGKGGNYWNPDSVGGDGGPPCNTFNIPTAIWDDLYGSGGGGGAFGEAGRDGGGGGGGAGFANVGSKGNNGSYDGSSANGGTGGTGGGVVRLYAKSVLLATGTINVDGADGAHPSPGGAGGGGGGGAGGSVYIEGGSCALGSNKISSSGGSGGTTYSGGGGAGGDGSDGRIAVKSKNITGTTTPAYYDIEKGVYS